MEKINPNKFYSAMQVQKILSIRVRQTLIKYIKNKQLDAIEIGEDDSGKRYAILGEDVITFKKRYDSGLVEAEKYSSEYVRMLLNRSLDYCKKNKIDTLEEFIISVKNLNENKKKNSLE